MTLVDQDARFRAMTDFSSILLVEAAAGTGKTSLMAGRVAMMLADGRRPGEIAAITFTELAASQLARRIRETLDTLLSGDVPAFLETVLPQGLSEQQREALIAASPRLDELTATTIHGFCQAIIRSHGVQTGLDPGARVVDATVADNLFMAELSAWFSQRLAADAAEDDRLLYWRKRSRFRWWALFANSRTSGANTQMRNRSVRLPTHGPTLILSKRSPISTGGRRMPNPTNGFPTSHMNCAGLQSAIRTVSQAKGISEPCGGSAIREPVASSSARACS
ncbi:UvrD-helicase domain-containing protein [Mesorhizobium sp. CC13]|uniref:UvrD-helicase domain-containing protein n=1 Tax=Mesorhizobium sp. CC13 TaxID=3029194 RepID=UPI0032651E24